MTSADIDQAEFPAEEALRASPGTAVAPAPVSIALQLHLVDDPNHARYPTGQLLGVVHGGCAPHIPAELHNTVVHTDVHVSIVVDLVGIEHGIDSIGGCRVDCGLLR